MTKDYIALKPDVIKSLFHANIAASYMPKVIGKLRITVGPRNRSTYVYMCLQLQLYMIMDIYVCICIAPFYKLQLS